MPRLGCNLTRLTRFGSWYRDYLILEYGPAGALRTVRKPGLLVSAEDDDQVTAQLSLDRLPWLFGGRLPDHLTTVAIENATRVAPAGG